MTEDSNNAEFIYEYAEKTAENINKSIDIVTDKLTRILAFSGVLLKFGVDMPSDGYLFSLKFVVIACIVIAIGSCAAGLRTQNREKLLKPDRLLNDHYGLDKERMHVMLTNALVEAIPELEKLRDYRISFLDLSIGCLVLSGCVFGLAGILSSLR
ncbi:MAG: hypothetical protein WA885_19310 [Phormidesmis sp.]